MKNPGLKTRSESTGQLFLVLITAFSLIISCKSREEKLIPVRDLVDILTEVYVADGLLSYPDIRAKFAVKDSITNYFDIIERHGYTHQRMDLTMRYYFDNNPKKLANIYDQVLTRLDEKQTLLEKEIPSVLMEKANLWPGKSRIAVPETEVKDPVWFSTQIKDTGNYVLDYTAIVFTDDESINTRASVFFWRTDSSKSENRINWPEVIYPKDAQRHTYAMKQRLTDSTFNHIGGWLLMSDPKEGRWEKHALLENLVLRKESGK